MEYKLVEMSDNRVMCLFMKICERLYYYAAVLEEGSEVDKTEALRWTEAYRHVKEEIIERGILDEAFNLN